MDAIRTEDKLILQYTVPGVKLDDIILELSEDEQGKLLTVGGFLHEDYMAKNEEYQIKELSGQEFRRVIRLPSDLSDKDPVSTLKDGILTLSFELLKKNTTTENNKVKKLKITEGWT